MNKVICRILNDSCIRKLGFKPMPKHFDKTQWKQGQKVEMEHTNNPQIAKLIAAHHLGERSDYYTMLAKVEHAKKMKRR